MARTIAIIGAIVTVAIPRLTHAAPRDIREFLLQLVGLLDLATFALFSVAIVVFFWGVVRNLWGYDANNAEQQKKLRETLFWGVIIIFVMVSIWGIIEMLQQTLTRGFNG